MMENLIKVKVLTNDFDHWYIVPNDLAVHFLKDLGDESMSDSGEFDEKYGRYKVGVNINFKQLYAVLEPDYDDCIVAAINQIKGI